MIKSVPEWNKQEYLMLPLLHEKSDWKPYLGEIIQAYKDFVKAASKFQKVLLIAPSKSDFAPFENIVNVDFFVCDTNDTWIRDFGAIDILEDDHLKALDFAFNAWGNELQSELDSEVNSKLSKEKSNEEFTKIDFILKDGSIDFNGEDVVLTSSNCLLNENRNSHLNKSQVGAKLKRILGLKQIIWLENGFIKGDDTDHYVDTLARFIDKNIIAHSICEDEKDEHYIPSQKMKRELETTGFNLVELLLPKPLYYKERRLGATYANFVFVNDALIMLFYKDGNDEIIRQRLAKALSKRKTIGVDVRAFLHQSGSLHCPCRNRFKGLR